MLVCACSYPDPRSSPLDGSSDVIAVDAPNDASPDAPILPTATPLVDFNAKTGVIVDGNNKVATWRDQSGGNRDATTTGSTIVTTTVPFNGASRTVLRFDGMSALTASPHVPPAGTLFIVYGAGTTTNNRALGWASFSTGADGLDIETGNPMQFIARKAGTSGDIVSTSPVTALELDVMSWGPAGSTLERHRPGMAVERRTRTGFTSIADGGFPLRIGGSGSPVTVRFTGDIASLRVYSEQLPANQRDGLASVILATP